MSIRGRVVFECDSKRCQAELVIDAEDADLVNGKRTPEAVFQASGWVLDDDGDLHCEQCCEEGREKGDDDGAEYADPRDEMMDRR